MDFSGTLLGLGTQGLGFAVYIINKMSNTCIHYANKKIARLYLLYISLCINLAYSHSVPETPVQSIQSSTSW